MEARITIINLIEQSFSDLGNNVIDFGPTIQRLEQARELSAELFNIHPNQLERQLGHRDLDSIQEAEFQKTWCLNDLENVLLNINNEIIHQHLNHAIHRLDLVNNFNGF